MILVVSSVVSAQVGVVSYSLVCCGVLWCVVSYVALGGQLSSSLFWVVCCSMLDVIMTYCDVVSIQTVRMQCE